MSKIVVLGVLYQEIMNKVYPFIAETAFGKKDVASLMTQSSTYNAQFWGAYIFTLWFSLTSFFGTGSRWRSAIELNAGVASFTEDGIMNSAQDNYVAWNKLYMEMMSRYGQESGKLSDTIVAYLLDIGVTEAQIENIRKILLDKTVI